MKRRQFLTFCLKSVVFASPVLKLAGTAKAGIQTLRQSLKKLSPKIYFPGDQDFSRLKEIINTCLSPKDPLAILKTKAIAEIGKVVKYNADHKINTRVRSAGHCFSGFSMGEGLVIDVRDLTEVKIDTAKNRVEAGAGLTLDRLRFALDKYGYTFPTGSCPSVGIAGYILGGGHSKKSRYLGLAADRVQAMDVILANGKSAYVSEKTNSDLYWALLGGGGGNFAVVTKFYLDLIPKPKEISFSIHASSEDYSEIFYQYERFLTESPESFSATLTFSTGRGKIKRATLSGFLKGDFTKHSDLVAEFKKVVPEKLGQLFDVKKSSLELLGPYQPLSPGFKSKTSFKGTSHYAEKPIGKNGFKLIEKALAETTTSTRFGRIEINPLGGKVLRPQRNNSYPHRQMPYIVALFAYMSNRNQAKIHQQNIAALRTQIEHLFSGRHYVNYPDFDLNQSTWQKSYFAENLNRLISIKKKYDPKNVFNHGNHSLASLT